MYLSWSICLSAVCELFHNGVSLYFCSVTFHVLFLQIKSRHLQASDQELFISLMTKFIESIKEGKQHHISSSGIGEEAGKTKLQATELSAPGATSDHEETTSKPSPHHEPKPVADPSAKAGVTQTSLPAAAEPEKESTAGPASVLSLQGLDGAKSAPSKKKQDSGDQSEPPASTHSLLNSQASLDSVSKYH